MPLKINGHIGMKLFNQPLMLDPAKADVIVAALGGRFGIDADMTPAIKAAMSAEYRLESGPLKIEGVEVIPIIGSLVHRAGGMDAMSGLMSYQEIGDMLLAAADDSSVKGILLDIDSPGGEVAGAFELVDTILEIKNKKPIWAVVNEHAYSAAYLLASAASKIFLPQTGGVGSIGVVAEHVDFSKANEMNGVTVTQIAAGKHKLDLSPDKPLSESGFARLQSMVDRTYGIFVMAVAANRGLSEKAVRNTQADIYFGQEAIDIGLADGIDSLDDVLNNMIQNLKTVSVPGTVLMQKGNDMRLFASKQKAEDKPAEAESAPAQVEQEEIESAPAEPETPAVEEPKAEDQVERAAAIADLCANNGLSGMTGAFIRGGETLAQIEARVDVANQIKTACKLAGKPDLAEGYIESGLSVAKVQESLLNKMAAEDEKISVTATPSPETVKESAQGQGNPLIKAVESRKAK